MMLLEDIKEELKGDSLYVEAEKRVFHRGQKVCIFHGMYACCGLGVLSNMNMTYPQFKQVTSTLYDVVVHNNLVNSGVGGYIATTGEAAGIEPDWFRNNEYWEEIDAFPNPVHEGTELQIWSITP